MRTSPGLETLISKRAYIKENVGLITNHTGIDAELNQNLELMRSAGYKIRALFSPEHGLFGDNPDGEYVQNSIHPETGIPIYSLFSETQKPVKAMLGNVDVLMFDIQDIGTRYYTYMSTMLLSMEAAFENNLGFVVLDRPNPLGGLNLEGNVTASSWISPVSYAQITIRHGMTAAEIALFVAANKHLKEPSIMKMGAWSRSMWFGDTGLPWVPTSPSAPTVEMALLYPGTCLLEGTNVSEGRGTSTPFQVFGAPWIKGPQLSKAINSMKLPGLKTRPVFFRPSFSKWSGQVCQGVQIHVFQPGVVRPVELGVRILFILRDLYPSDFQLTLPNSHGKRFLDILCGGNELSLALERDGSPEALLYKWKMEANTFAEKRRDYLIYS